MKLLIAANCNVGLYLFRKELVETLLQEHQVTVSVPFGEYTDQLREMGCGMINTPVDRRGIDPVKDLKLFAQYIKILKKQKPDLVVTYTIKPNIYCGFACRLLKIPYAANITGLGTAFQSGGLLRSLVTVLYRTSLKKARVVFFENEDNRQTFITQKILRPEKTVRLNGAGVNLERYSFKPYPATEPVRFLFVGRVMSEKGIDELFTVMDRLHEEGATCTLDVLGYYEEDYADIIRDCERKGWLRYHGYRQDVRPFIEKAHCFVLPSYHEGMANTNLECAAMGRPVITSDIPGCKEAVIDGKSGMLCRVRDSESLYDAMSRFLQLSAAEKEAMGVAGRRHMEEVFDKRRVVAETVRHLEMK